MQRPGCWRSSKSKHAEQLLAQVRQKLEAVLTASEEAAPMASSTCTAPTLLLDRRAWHRAKRTEHTTISRLRAQQRMTGRALVIELAGIRWHGFLLGMTAARAGQHGFEIDHTHGGVTSAQRTGSPRLLSLGSTFRAWSCQRHR